MPILRSAGIIFYVLQSAELLSSMYSLNYKETSNIFDLILGLYQIYPATAEHTHMRSKALIPELHGWAGTRKVKPIWILLKQETVSGSGISWAICKSALCSRRITMPAPHHSVFYRPDARHSCHPSNSVEAQKAELQPQLKSGHIFISAHSDPGMIWMLDMKPGLSILLFLRLIV